MKIKDKLNGNTGVVITTGMILCLITITSFGFAIMDRVEAFTAIKVDNQIHLLKEELTETLHSIDNRLAVIESKVGDSK